MHCMLLVPTQNSVFIETVEVATLSRASTGDCRCIDLRFQRGTFRVGSNGCYKSPTRSLGGKRFSRTNTKLFQQWTCSQSTPMHLAVLRQNAKRMEEHANRPFQISPLGIWDALGRCYGKWRPTVRKSACASPVYQRAI